MKMTGFQAKSLPRFLTVEEVAEMLRVKPRTIYDWVSQRRVPFRKAGDRTETNLRGDDVGGCSTVIIVKDKS